MSTAGPASDYPDRRRFPNTASEYAAYGALYDGIIGVIQGFDLYCWVATQDVRGSSGGEFSGDEEISRSWLKVANADRLVYLLGTRPQRDAGRAPMNMESTRRGENALFTLSVDYANCTVKEVAPWKGFGGRGIIRGTSLVCGR